MASGFVPAGGGSDSQPEDAAWREARQAVEAARSQSDEEIQHGKPGESLYGILQANKGGSYSGAPRTRVSLRCAMANMVDRSCTQLRSKKPLRNLSD